MRAPPLFVLRVFVARRCELLQALDVRLDRLVVFVAVEQELECERAARVAHELEVDDAVALVRDTTGDRAVVLPGRWLREVELFGVVLSDDVERGEIEAADGELRAWAGEHGARLSRVTSRGSQLC